MSLEEIRMYKIPGGNFKLIIVENDDKRNTRITTEHECFAEDEVVAILTRLTQAYS